MRTKPCSNSPAPSLLVAYLCCEFDCIETYRKIVAVAMVAFNRVRSLTGVRVNACETNTFPSSLLLNFGIRIIIEYALYSRPNTSSLPPNSLQGLQRRQFNNQHLRYHILKDQVTHVNKILKSPTPTTLSNRQRSRRASLKCSA